MKLPSVDTGLCFKQVFENISASRNTCSCSTENSTSYKLRDASLP